MTVLITLSLLSLAGIGAAFWFLKGEQESDEGSLSEALEIAEKTASPSSEEAPRPVSERKQGSSILKRLLALREKGRRFADADTDESTAPSKLKELLSPLSGLLKKLKIRGRNEETEDGPETVSLPSLKNLFQDDQEDTSTDEPKTGTASIKTVASERSAREQPSPKARSEEKTSENESALSSQLSGLQEKYQKLDALFKEKSAELQKTKESLDNEIKNRKEFENVKELLEKEITDSKDRTRNIQAEGENAAAEIKRYEKRAAQFEEKADKLEKDLIEKDNKINELLNRLEVFTGPVEKTKNNDIYGASFSPPITPPAMEGPEQREEADPPMTEIPVPETTDDPNQEVLPRQISIDDEVAQDDDTTQLGGSSFEAEPPAPYNEASNDDEPQEDGGFLKLQPDVLSGSPESDGSIANEIEQSLQSPPEPEIKPDPGQPLRPGPGPENEGLYKPAQESGSSSEDPEEEPENTDNTKE